MKLNCGKPTKTSPILFAKTSSVGIVLGKKGQGLVEYIILVALLAITSIAVVRVLGQALNSRLASISYAIQGERRTPPVDAIPENHLRKRDLGNFMEGVGSSDRNSN